MESGDGLLLRVKPRLARLSAEQARILAGAAERHGNGWLELTQRANLQLRGLRPETLEPFTRTMLAAGLADADPGVERRRNIVAPPLPSPEAEVLLGALEAVLADAGFAALPGKFGLALSEDAACAAADIMLRLAAGVVEIRLPGGDALARCGAVEAPAAVRALIRHFLSRPRPRRMADAVAAEGAAAILTAAGLTPLPDAGAGPAPAAPIGPLPGGFGLGLPFGQMAAATLRALAGIAAREGDGTLRLTPWRALILPGLRALDLPEMITDPADPRRRIAACPGSAGCASGRAPVRADAEALIRMGALPGAGLLHLSGCAKGCAHPRPAPLTLVAEAAGRYALIRQGRAGDPPARTGLTLAEAAAMMEKQMSGPYDYIRDGAAIYAKSFATIRAEADLARFTPEEARVAVRVIHACGLVEVARLIRFAPGFATAARAALLRGAPILCDSQMVAHGITRARLPAGNAVICTLSDPGVPERARRIGNTRSAAALDLWGEKLGGAVVAIGNAPTALFHLLELLDAGAPPPAAIIGLPVGFVGAAESKLALAEDNRAPWMIVEGRQGGSAMAVAAVNALASDAE